MTTVAAREIVDETRNTSRDSRTRTTQLVGQLDDNQGRLTHSGRLTLDQFCDLTIVHNRKWADGADIGIEQVTQREIIENHANALALFILQGTVHATAERIATNEKAIGQRGQGKVLTALSAIQDQIGTRVHYGLPQVTLVLEHEPTIRVVKDKDGEAVAARLFLPAGEFFVVADGQHRREAARRVRDFLIATISNRYIPKGYKFYEPEADGALPEDVLGAWIAVYATFKSISTIAYEAHLGITVDEARQLFTNFNCHVQPVKAILGYEFDQSNPINQFAKNWLIPMLEKGGARLLDLRESARVNGFLFIGKSSIQQAPFNLDKAESVAKEFWRLITSLREWKRKESLLREMAILKGLAKAWFMVYLAKRNGKPDKATHLVKYIRDTRFDDEWVKSIRGLRSLITESNGIWHVAPTHNEIVTLLVHEILSS